MNAEQTSSIHPTRTAPHCVDCAHCVKTSGIACNHPSQPVHLAWGFPTAPCNELRAVDGACGPEGRLFQPAGAEFSAA